MTTTVFEYHAHIYFDAGTLQQATDLCISTRDRFNIPMGTIHQRNVGPHPCWSCLLIFPPQLLAEMIEFLTFSRNGLAVFIHPDTGDDLKDHTEHLIWLGESKKLKIEQFL